MQTVILIASCVFCLQTASSMCAAVNKAEYIVGIYRRLIGWELKRKRDSWQVVHRIVLWKTNTSVELDMNNWIL